jgi:hypothetical protein
MMSTARPKRRYDHRLRDLVHHTGDATIARDLGVPRSTARGWLGATPGPSSVWTWRISVRRTFEGRSSSSADGVRKLAALLRLVLVVWRRSGFDLSHERLADGRNKMQLGRAVDRARAYIPLRALLQFLHVSPSRFHTWRRQDACALNDESSCPRTSPHRLTLPEIWAIKDMVTSPDYRHVPTGTLAELSTRTFWTFAREFSSLRRGKNGYGSAPLTWTRILPVYSSDHAGPPPGHSLPDARESQWSEGGQFSVVMRPRRLTGTPGPCIPDPTWSCTFRSPKPGSDRLLLTTGDRTLDRSEVGNSWWTCRRAGPDRDGGDVRRQDEGRRLQPGHS